VFLITSLLLLAALAKSERYGGGLLLNPIAMAERTGSNKNIKHPFMISLIGTCLSLCLSENYCRNAVNSTQFCRINL
jgi:hypothetical protein